MDTVENMTCDWCGKVFPADPRACLESGVDAVHGVEEGEEWKGEQPISLDPEQFTDQQRQELKAAFEIDDAQLETLIRTGKVEGLASIVCLECQEEAFADVEG